MYLLIVPFFIFLAKLLVPIHTAIGTANFRVASAFMAGSFCIDARPRDLAIFKSYAGRRILPIGRFRRVKYQMYSIR